MINVEDKELMNKIRMRILKRRQKSKVFTESFSEKSEVRVSNFNKFVKNKNIRFNSSRAYIDQC